MAPTKRVAPTQKPTKKRKLEEKLPSVDAQVVKELRDEMLDGIDESWQGVLSQELISANGEQVLTRLADSIQQKKDIFPPTKYILNAFKLTPMNKVKVVILGQDPYHNTGQAMGLAFSVPQAVQKMPPSLPRILREAGIAKDLSSKCGDLTTWAQQGVLLLNPVLTVEKGRPGSHGNWGWQKITSEALTQLSKQTTTRRIVFLLWGGKAAAAEALIDKEHHLVLRASHPSPLATRGDFMGCGHFLKANECLIEQGLRPIQWDSLVQEDWRMEEDEAMVDNPVTECGLEQAMDTDKPLEISKPMTIDPVIMDASVEAQLGQGSEPPIIVLAIAAEESLADQTAAALATLAAVADSAPISAPHETARNKEEIMADTSLQSTDVLEPMEDD